LEAVEADRDQWQRPEDVIRALDLKHDDVVADIGARADTSCSTELQTKRTALAGLSPTYSSSPGLRRASNFGETDTLWKRLWARSYSEWNVNFGIALLRLICRQSQASLC
jgi:hypothetical protein